MKKIVKLIMPAFLAFAVLLVIPTAFRAEAATEGYLTYKVENGKATITDCDSSISGGFTIPLRLGGYPVKSIGYRAFGNCTGLTSITIPNSVTSIWTSAFENCTGLTSITIPNSVTSIAASAFEACTGLKSITISDSVTSIGTKAFYNTAWYKSQPNGDVYAGKVYYKYKGTMPGDTKVAIKSGTKGIAVAAFYDCAGLTSITIPNTVTSIGASAFNGCAGLTSITIPNSVTYIDRFTFSECDSLTSITIPDSVTSIDYMAFNGTAWYKSQPNGDVYAGKVYYTYKGKMPSGTKLVIKNGTKGIAGDAFSGCAGLTSITIPNSVTSIGESAFSGCAGLTSITIPNGITSINGSTFFGCASLTNIVIPNTVTSIGYAAFLNCKGLTSITIPNSVTIIGAFAFKGCAGLTSITIPSSVISIGSCAFVGCAGLTSITIPNNVMNIGENAFEGCTGLTSVVIPNSVISIGSCAFVGCAGLTSIAIYSKVCDIYDSSYTLPSTAKIIGLSGSTAEAYAKKYNRTFEVHNHSFSAWNTTQKSTCTKAGSQSRTCSVCKNTESKSIPALGHSYSSSWTIDKAATCTESGSKSQHCTRCGDKKDVTLIAATGHKFSSWKTAKKATCTKAGSKQRTCSVCKKTETKKLSALGHSYKITKIKAKATLSKNGSAVTKCKRCGLTSSKTVIYKIKTVKLSASSFVYNGKAKTPTVTVKDSKGRTLKKNTDYTVKYSSGRKNIGTYTVTVTFKGNYSGQKSLKFKIVLGQVSGVAQMNKKGINFAWNKVAGASGYEVYSYDAPTKRYVKLAATKKTQLGNSGAKGKMKIKIRAFKKVGSKTYYGSFSKPVTFKAK